MKIDMLKKGLISLALSGSFVLSIGATSPAQAQAWRQHQRQERRENRWDEWRERRADRLERAQEREELRRIRQLDRQRQLRYQSFYGNRMVGYYDRVGQFHPVGYYDRFGRFWRYQ